MPTLDTLMKSRRVRLNRAISLKVLAYAKEKNDPDYRRLMALRKAYLMLKKKLRSKYSAIVRPEVIKHLYEQKCKRIKEDMRATLKRLFERYSDQLEI